MDNPERHLKEWFQQQLECTEEQAEYYVEHCVGFMIACGWQFEPAARPGQ